MPVSVARFPSIEVQGDQVHVTWLEPPPESHWAYITVDQSVHVAFGRSLREQQAEEVALTEIGTGIRRLLLRGPDADFAKMVCQKVVGPACRSGREACEELRGALLGHPLAPFTTRADGHRRRWEYRVRWQTFCNWMKREWLVYRSSEPSIQSFPICGLHNYPTTDFALFTVRGILAPAQ